MAEQSLHLTRDYREAARRVARGEYPLYLPYILSDIINLKGLPVKALVPEEGAAYVAYAAGTLNKAPHPNAARLLLDFYLSEEGQAIYAREAHGIVVKELAEKLPPEVEALARVKLMVPAMPRGPAKCMR
jgi:iron(III) transport system substrate-binding protein